MIPVTHRGEEFNARSKTAEEFLKLQKTASLFSRLMAPYGLSSSNFTFLNHTMWPWS